ncbi:FMN-dependent NADH-azoreductase [Steroidobacter sp. S1-65]|uniref:FMN dependent NADH:quinone oxidoreductase n=1 Tax=Steroidobacter gossypii TaxID=2805490 RepID=A0ABS1X3F2_9GAMM|nr:FMN-dependent NADH-azoreductase [Steroidobacter gossypii]MBM0107754.1 FMN-dependent NADH-azoreductase [Steroidobacter gossypii]
MSTLLQINASLAGAEGQSSRLAHRFVADWQAQHPGGHVIMRDLASDPVPHLTAERFQAFLSPPEARTLEQSAAAEYSDALIAELKAADTIVFAVPMYNFSVPSTLRAYFDHIARAGVTFSYTASGPEGLLKGKKAYVFITRGGIYPDAADTQTPYLKQFLGFIGITDVTFVYAQGLAMGQETAQKSITAAHSAIEELLPRAA